VAIRQEELLVREAIVYPFPTHMAARRESYRRMMARRRTTLGVVTVAMAIATLASLPTL
jgi:hypothetical protein